jgi:hypothetical protein
MDTNWAINVFPSFKVEFISYYWIHNGSLAKSRTYDPVNNVLDTIPIPSELNKLPSFGGANFSIPATRAAGFLSPSDRNVSFVF